jgi:hypothetical protein
MAKRSGSHQATVDCLRVEQREKLAYHFILTAIANGSTKWGSLKRVGSVYDAGDSWVWQITFTPRLIDGVIMESFTGSDGQESIRCFYLADLYHAYANRSFSSTDVNGKFCALYLHAVEMERIAQNAETFKMTVAS